MLVRFIDPNTYQHNERTPMNSPYSYDPFLVWECGYDKRDSTLYSDRLHSQDYNNYNSCCEKVWNNSGQNFSSRKYSEIEEFLSLYLKTPIQLTRIIEACNISNGYPYWVFNYRKKNNNND